MNCETVLARLSEFHDGELDQATAAEVDNHLAKCSGCRVQLAEFATMGQMLKKHDEIVGSRWTKTPSWESCAARMDSLNRASARQSAGLLGSRFTFWGAAALAATVLLVVMLKSLNYSSLVSNSNSESTAHRHEHTHSTSEELAIDFAKLLDGATAQPELAFDWLSNRFEGQEAGLDESESQLGYRPSISKALPNGVQLVSNRILKLPKCKCAAGQCSCGPAGCNCAASLCKRRDGSEFLVVEHCATQSISFGDMRSEVVHGDADDVTIVNAGSLFTASWIANHRRLTAIGLNDKAEALAIVAGLATR